uniref:Nuclear pore complex protein n=1 Tax=Fibrocapsa japonica TaxID=94617 RepID=A0A7S2UWT5_9STRA
MGRGFCHKHVFLVLACCSFDNFSLAFIRPQLGAKPIQAQSILLPEGVSSCNRWPESFLKSNTLEDEEEDKLGLYGNNAIDVEGMLAQANQAGAVTQQFSQVDKTQASRFSKVVLAEAKKVEMNYRGLNMDNLKQSVFSKEIMREIAGSSTATRCDAFKQIFGWASRQTYNQRKVSWVVKASAAALLWEDSITTEQITQCIVNGIRVASAPVPEMQNRIREEGIEEQIWKQGGWVVFLYETAMLPLYEKLPEVQHYLIQEAMITYFDMGERDTVKHGDITRASLFADALDSVLPNNLGLQMTLQQVEKEVMPPIEKTMMLIIDELKPPTEKAIFWVEVKVREVLRNVLDRGAKDFEGEPLPAEKMSAIDLAEVALHLARLSIFVFWQLDGESLKQDPTLEVFLRVVNKHIYAAAPFHSQNLKLYGTYVTHYIQTALTGTRPMDSLASMDALILQEMYSMAPMYRRQVVEYALPKVAASIMYRNRKTPEKLNQACWPMMILGLDIDQGFTFDPEDPGTNIRRETLNLFMRYAKLQDPDNAVADGRWAADFMGLEAAEVEQLEESQKTRKLQEALTQALGDVTISKADLRQGAARQKGFDVAQQGVDEEELAALVRAGAESGMDPPEAAEAVAQYVKTQLLFQLKEVAFHMDNRNYERSKASARQCMAYASIVVPEVMNALGRPGDDPTKLLEIRAEDVKDEVEFQVSELCWAMLDRGEELETARGLLTIMGLN